jgi:uncharacterized protein YraI
MMLCLEAFLMTQRHNTNPQVSVARYTLVLPLILCLTFIMSGCSLTASDTAISATPVFTGVPSVKLASPLPNETYLEGASINILGRIENAGADIQMVEILLDNQSIGSQMQPNEGGNASFTVTNSWQAMNSGNHVITLRAVRADGSAGEASVTIAVESASDASVDASAVQVTPTVDLGLPTPIQPAQVAPTLEPTSAVTATLAPTTAPAVVATATNTTAPVSTAPQITVISGANVRSGPSTAFNPPIISLVANTTAPIVAISPDRQWYKIQINNTTGWISATTVTTTGELGGLTIDAGPATPIPQPTAVPATGVPTATTAPATNTDLSITFVGLSPDPLVCNQAGVVTVTIVNSGASASAETTVLIQDLYNGNAGASASATVKSLGQNESIDITLSLTVSTNFAEGHTLRARIDPDNRVSETNEQNNDNNKAYTLATGGC